MSTSTWIEQERVHDLCRARRPLPGARISACGGRALGDHAPGGLSRELPDREDVRGAEAWERQRDGGVLAEAAPSR